MKNERELHGDFAGRVAIVTGAGAGLGRSYARLLAKHGARLVVNDLAVRADGTSAAEMVAREIQADGGEAIANLASVTDPAAMESAVAVAHERWGRVDILINNAGILRDSSFAKMSLDDFRAVLDVHLMGSVICTKAVWNLMRQQAYGRIVMATSSSGLYGNFGQANYGSAKMALVGLMQTLSIEGERSDIRVNCIAPTAGTAMLDGLLPDGVMKQLDPDLVSPGLLALVGTDAPTRTILCAGAGHFAQAFVTLTEGLRLEDATARTVAEHWSAIGDRRGETVPGSGRALIELELSTR